MAGGEKLAVAVTASRSPTAVRRLGVTAGCFWRRSECCMSVSVAGIDCDQREAVARVRRVRFGSGRTVDVVNVSMCVETFQRNAMRRQWLIRRQNWSFPMPAVAPMLAEIAQMVADPGRANILSTLMGGHALTAGELAIVAGVTPQT